MAESLASTSNTYGQSGYRKTTFGGFVARSDTTAKELFRLAAGTIPVGIRIGNVGAASNAGTNATLAIGSTSNATYFLGGFDVKTAGALTNGGGTQAIPSSPAHFYQPLDFDTIVTATYAEAGSASTTGGPWYVELEVLRDV